MNSWYRISPLAASHHTSNDLVSGRSHPRYPMHHERCDIEHVANPSLDHHESGPLSVPVSCDLHRRCMTILRIRWLSVHGTPYEALSLASLVWLYIHECTHRDAVGKPATPGRQF